MILGRNRHGVAVCAPRVGGSPKASPHLLHNPQLFLLRQANKKGIPLSYNKIQFSLASCRESIMFLVVQIAFEDDSCIMIG